MAIEINFTYQGKKYTLGFSRSTIRQMEGAGFNINQIQNFPETYIPRLFAGSFLLHHRGVKQDEINTMFKKFTRKDELIDKLSKAYMEALDTLMDDPADDDPNAIQW